MQGDCLGNFFVIFTLGLFFMLLYVYATPQMTIIQERFNQLLPPDKIQIIQGNAVPIKNPQQVIFDQDDPAAQSVDGTKDGPKSIFTFAYNKCSPECCVGSPYSCNGGCVCLTAEQKKYFSRLS